MNYFIENMWIINANFEQVVKLVVNYIPSNPFLTSIKSEEVKSSMS